jgi:hypothetical protein
MNSMKISEKSHDISHALGKPKASKDYFTSPLMTQTFDNQYFTIKKPELKVNPIA